MNARNNNFGLLRLFFAILVLMGHSTELLDGNHLRDPLTVVLGTNVFSADIAVNGFFIVSGYLILSSFDRSSSLQNFFINRWLRIYPGYFVAFMVSLLLVAPIAGADIREISIFKTTVKLVLLGLPSVPHTFEGLPHPELNGSLWTISYEFRCYISTIVFATYIRHTGGLLQLLLFCSICYFCLNRMEYSDIPFLNPLLGSTNASLRFIYMYLCGAIFYVYKDKIVLNNTLAASSAVLLVIFMASTHLGELAFGFFGSYIIFWAAFRCPASKMSGWANSTDLSYGIYLYAWPIQNILIYYYNGISPLYLFFLTLPNAIICAIASWHFVEKPFLRYKRENKIV